MITIPEIPAAEELILHRTFQTLDPKVEMAGAQKPEGIKIMLYTGKTTHFEFTLTKDHAFNLAMEILPHAYRWGRKG